MRDACARFAPDAGLAIRWPNDVVDRDGRKVAGLLVETALEGEELVEAVIGIGINVNWPVSEMPAEIAERATSLLELTGAPIDRVELLRSLLDALGAEVAALERGETPLLAPARQLLARRAAGRGRHRRRDDQRPGGGHRR